MDVHQAAEQFRVNFRSICDEVGKLIVGYDEVIENVVIAMLAQGNVLLEGVPGLGKTYLIKSLGEAMNLVFRRVQFTTDLMPADIIGTNMIVWDEAGRQHYEFQKGPIFTNLLLADEINRSTPKTQSALLEAMEEHNVTVWGKTYALPEPFMVLATQNPIEQEGTYPLPHAQLDKFMFKLIVEYLSEEEMDEIMIRTTEGHYPDLHAVADRETARSMQDLVRQVPVARHVEEYACRLIMASHPDYEHAPPRVRQYVDQGASPRGIQALLLGAKAKALIAGRFAVSCGDIRGFVPQTLRHRLSLNLQGTAEQVDVHGIITEILEQVDEPADLSEAKAR